jgi:hypothetical protein
MIGVQSSSGVAASPDCDLKQLMTHIELTVLPALNLVNRKLDKKSEKQLLATQQHVSTPTCICFRSTSSELQRVSSAHRNLSSCLGAAIQLPR